VFTTTQLSRYTAGTQNSLVINHRQYAFFLLQGHTKEGQAKEGQAKGRMKEGQAEGRVQNRVKNGQAEGQAKGRMVHLRVTRVIPVTRQVCCATESTTVIEKLV